MLDWYGGTAIAWILFGIAGYLLLLAVSLAIASANARAERRNETVWLLRQEDR
jgi:hypothetical protein